MKRPTHLGISEYGSTNPVIALRLISVAFVITVLVIGCQDAGRRPDVPVGTFRAHIVGAVEDTLKGSVRYRMRGDRLVGLELGDQETQGLSIDLEPKPLKARTYEVVSPELVEADRSGEAPGVVVFLSVGGAHFVATDGQVELTYLGEDQVAGTFDVSMDGEFEKGPSETLSVDVTGAFSAERRVGDASPE